MGLCGHTHGAERGLGGLEMVAWSTLEKASRLGRRPPTLAQPLRTRCCALALARSSALPTPCHAPPAPPTHPAPAPVPPPVNHPGGSGSSSSSTPFAPPPPPRPHLGGSYDAALQQHAHHHQPRRRRHAAHTPQHRLPLPPGDVPAKVMLALGAFVVLQATRTACEGAPMHTYTCMQGSSTWDHSSSTLTQYRRVHAPRPHPPHPGTPARPAGPAPAALQRQTLAASRPLPFPLPLPLALPHPPLPPPGPCPSTRRLSHVPPSSAPTAHAPPACSPSCPTCPRGRDGSSAGGPVSPLEPIAWKAE